MKNSSRFIKIKDTLKADEKEALKEIAEIKRKTYHLGAFS